MRRTIRTEITYDPVRCIKSEIRRCFGDKAEILYGEDRSKKHDPDLVRFTLRRLNYGWILIQEFGVGYTYRHHFNRFLLALREHGDLIEINDGWRFRLNPSEGREA